MEVRPRVVANHCDVVPVRTNDESCIVGRVVVRAQTRRTIVFATGFQSSAVESFDLLAILGRERQVKMRRLLVGLEQALVVSDFGSEAARLGKLGVATGAHASDTQAKVFMIKDPDGNSIAFTQAP